MQAIQLRGQMSNIPADAEFVIRVGDLRNADHHNTHYLAVYTNASSLLRLSHATIFVLLGDNDWNACPNMNDAWSYWQSEFLHFESR